MTTIDQLSVSATVAAQMLGISRPTLYVLLNRGDIPSFRVGARRLISTAVLAAWVEQQTMNGAGKIYG